MSLQARIESYYDSPQLFESTPNQAVVNDIQETLALLDSGQARVCAYDGQTWLTHAWLKKAVLLSFKIWKNQGIDCGFNRAYDKVPAKFQNLTDTDFQATGVRIVPPAHVRYGAYIGPKTVVMPSFINIGAYIDEGCMIDTWATVGSCAQIGKGVHISGGAGIGGVLEPLQATPTIVEDHCFIGARSEIVEGVIVEKNSVISMGVFIGQSTKIYDRNSQKVYQGRVPAGSVVVPGSLPSADGTHQLQAAIIVKTIDEKTRQKTALNDILHAID